MFNIAFRADSSHEIGTGHIMRCLTLAQQLNDQCSVSIYFFSRSFSGNINKLIVQLGFNLIAMDNRDQNKNNSTEHFSWLGTTQQQDATEFLQLSDKLMIDKFDLIVIDHYAIDHIWQNLITHQSHNIMVIDDLGNRKHQCDLLLDQTLNCPRSKYKHKIPPNSKTLLGSHYTLLRNEFTVLINDRTNRSIHSLLIMFGGTDPNNLTLSSLSIIQEIKYEIKIDIILGSTSAHLTSISHFIADKPNITLHISPTNIAELMANSTLAIGSAGTSTWERCASGLPTIIIIDGENQRENAIQLDKLGVVTFIEQDNIDKELMMHYQYWTTNRAHYQGAVEKCLTVCDGKGTQRVVDSIIKLLN